jgi:hypothetical protein
LPNVSPSAFSGTKTPREILEKENTAGSILSWRHNAGIWKALRSPAVRRPISLLLNLFQAH